MLVSRRYKMINLIVLCLLINCVYGQDILNLSEGSKCSKDGVDGVCASVYNCLTAAEDIKKKDYPLVCGYRGKVPIICCTDCELVNDTRTMYISATSGKWYFRNGQKSRDKCFDYMQQLDPCNGHYSGKIAKSKHMTRNCYEPYPTAVGAVGGQDAYRAEFPHMALLGYGSEVEAAQWLCGGSVISEKFILTAGHCTASSSLGPVKYIGLGILKRSDPEELWQRHLVKKVITHPEYKPPSKYHDIALLETDKRITFNDRVRPACLHFQKVENDAVAKATGWGALGLRRELADTLQIVELDEYTERECSTLYPPSRLQKRGYDPDSQMCYGKREKIRDTCGGDSGGPLQNKIFINHCQYTVLGVTSTGHQCGVVGSTGIYTRVLPYLRWIENIVWP